MITVESYFKINEEFIKIDDYNGDIPEDINHFDGAIVIIANGKPVITLQHWDYVVVFWAFIVGGFSDTLLLKETKVGFPDQPSELRFIPSLNDRIVIFFNDQKITSIDRGELLEAISRGAIKFFSRLIELDANNKELYEKYLKNAYALEKK